MLYFPATFAFINVDKKDKHGISIGRIEYFFANIEFINSISIACPLCPHFVSLSLKDLIRINNLRKYCPNFTTLAVGSSSAFIQWLLFSLWFLMHWVTFMVMFMVI